MTFFRQPLLLGVPRWACGTSALGDVQALSQQTLKAFDDLGAIAVLATGRLGGQVEATVAIDVGVESAAQPGALFLIQAWGAGYIEGQFDLRLRTVDVLASRAATAAELEVQLRQRDSQGARDR
jgi:hypothetical protein